MTVEGMVTSDGVRLHVESAGEGPPILFVAGYCASLATWAFQVEAAVAAGFRAVAFDRRWHGRSERPDYGHRIARHAADLREVIAALGLVRPLLVGASMGASICWSYLDLFGGSGIAGMVGIDQTPRMVNDRDWRYGFYGLDGENLGRFFSDGVPPTGRGRPSEETMAAFGRLQAKVGDVALVSAPTTDTLPLLDDHARQDWRDVCRRADAPMLMVAARESELWPCEHAVAAVAGNARAEYLIVEDCGHAVQADRPDELSQAVLRFAERCVV